MTRNYHRIKETSGRRQPNVILVSTTRQQQNGRRVSTFINAQRRLSIMSQISLPHGAEYRPQQRLPPNGLESQQNILLRNIPAMIEYNPKQFHLKSTKKPKRYQNRFLHYLCCTVDNESKYGYDINTYDD